MLDKESRILGKNTSAYLTQEHALRLGEGSAEEWVRGNAQKFISQRWRPTLFPCHHITVMKNSPESQIYSHRTKRFSPEAPPRPFHRMHAMHAWHGMDFFLAADLTTENLAGDVLATGVDMASRVDDLLSRVDKISCTGHDGQDTRMDAAV